MRATDNYVRFERVDSVADTATGCWPSCTASGCGSTWSATTSCGSRSAAAACSTSRRRSRSASTRWPSRVGLHRRARRRRVAAAAPRALLGLAVARPVPARRAPRRRHAGGRDRADADGRYWAYATLNDAFTLRRRCRPGGRDLRAGREDRAGTTARAATSRCGTPTCSTRTRRAEFTAGQAPDDPRADRRQHRVRPVLRLHPVLLPPGLPGRADGRVVRRQRLPRPLRLLRRPRSTGSTSSGGQYTEYVFAGPDMPAILEAYTWLTGRTAPPPLWALGYHQCRWFDYTQDAVEADRRRHRELRLPCDALWLDIEYMDGYRVFTWNTERFPDPPGCWRRLAEQGFRVITIIDPGVKHEPGLRGLRRRRWSATCCAGPRAATSTSARSGRATPRSPTSSPRRRRDLVGRAQRRARAVRAGRDLERHERAGHRRHPARRRCASTAARTPTSATTTSTRC